MQRFLFVALGSLGDLHPFIAVGLALQGQGHHVGFCTFTDYHTRLEHLGFHVYGLRTGHLSVDNPDLLAYVMDAKQGGQRLLSEFIYPHIQEQYDDVTAAVTVFQPSLLIAGELAFATRLVSEKTGIPWVSAVLQPLAMYSLADPSVLPVLPPIPGWLSWVNPLVMAAANYTSNQWAKPYHHFRQQLGLAAIGNPAMSAKFSPYGVMVMVDPVFARPQPDWPKHAVQTGFAFYDGEPSPVESDLMTFCQNGSPPIVVTLGSAAVYAAQDFYAQAARAIDALGQRGVLLLGHNPVPADLPAHIKAVEYVRHSALFPFASLVIHQGGIGTTAQTLRAGVPSLVVPFSHDQPDNAHRLKRLGVGQVLNRSQLSIDRLIKACKACMPRLPQHNPAERARRLQSHLALGGHRKAAHYLVGLSTFHQATHPVQNQA
jgi:rhamnosyltransferase subunit B